MRPLILCFCDLCLELKHCFSVWCAPRACCSFPCFSLHWAKQMWYLSTLANDKLYLESTFHTRLAALHNKRELFCLIVGRLFHVSTARCSRQPAFTVRGWAFHVCCFSRGSQRIPETLSATGKCCRKHRQCRPLGDWLGGGDTAIADV